MRRLLCLVVFLMLITLVLGADVSLKLDKTKYGKQQYLLGNLTLEVKDMPTDGKLVFYINNNEVLDVNLSEVAGWCDIVPEEYTPVGDLSQEVTVEFDQPSSKVEVALAYYAEGERIESGNLTLVGLQKDSEYPYNFEFRLLKCPESTLSWHYVGDLIYEHGNLVWNYLHNDYLFDYLTQTSVEVTTATDEFYCEKVTLVPSRRYKILVCGRGSGDSPRFEGLIISDSGVIMASTHLSKTNNNCVKGKTDFYWYTGNLGANGFVIENPGEYYLCLDVIVGKFDLAKEDTSLAKSAAYKCRQSGDLVSCESAGNRDYFIVGKWAECNNSFDKVKTFTNLTSLDLGKCSLDETVEIKHNTHLVSYRLIPFMLRSESKGKVKINATEIKVRTAGDEIEAIYSPLVKISFLPERFNCSEKVESYLGPEDYQILTPRETGDYKLKVLLISNSHEYASDEEEFKVKAGPSVYAVIPSVATVGQEVKFNCTATGNEPLSYYWDFGDGSNSTSAVATHAYNYSGEFTVTLIVTDNESISTVVSRNITIFSPAEFLQDLIPETMQIVANISSSFASASEAVKEVIELLNLDEELQNISTQLVQINSTFVSTAASLASLSSKTQTYVQLYESLEELRARVPVTINAEKISISPMLNSPEEIPDLLYPYGVSSQEKASHKEGVFSLQEKLTADANYYVVDITYLDGRTESFRIVEKQISCSANNGSIIEYLPEDVGSFSEDNILQADDCDVNEQYLECSLSVEKIVYKLPEGALEDLTATKTFLFVEEGFQPTPAGETWECGNGICERIEAELDLCPQDCPKMRIWPFILLGIILIAGVYYFNFYKGPWNFKDLANFISVKLAKRRIFTSKEDMLKLEGYVRKMLAQGMTEQQLRYILAKKGWTEEQLNYIFEKVKR